jgi:hypothetical protein
MAAEATTVAERPILLWSQSILTDFKKFPLSYFTRRESGGGGGGGGGGGLHPGHL